jgi:transposase
MESKLVIAGIDVHKKMLAVVLVDVDNPQQELARKKFATEVSELGQLSTWLESNGVSVVVMESTAQYWKPVWLALEEKFLLHLAQAQSNAAPRGRMSDFVDALRLARRFLASELKLSFVPGEEQRRWRCLSRSKHQLRRQRVRLHSQIEALLEESQIKLSSVVTDLLGATGQRILGALVKGETDPEKLAELAANNLKVSQPELVAALMGKIHEVHRIVLGMQLRQLELIDQQIAELHRQLGKSLQIHQEPIARLCEIPGLKEDAAQQILPELGPEAAVFASAEQMASWIRVCPGREESAGESRSNRSPKGNRTMRRLLNQIAWGAVRTKGCFFKELFHRLVPRLGIHKAIWAIAHRIAKVIWKVLHDKVRYIERGPLAQDPKAMQRRVATLARQMRKLGYTIEVKPIAATSN